MPNTDQLLREERERSNRYAEALHGVLATVERALDEARTKSGDHATLATIRNDIREALGIDRAE